MSIMDDSGNSSTETDVALEMRPSKVFSDQDLNDHQRCLRKLYQMRRKHLLSRDEEINLEFNKIEVTSTGLPCHDSPETSDWTSESSETENDNLQGIGIFRKKISMDGKWYERFYLKNEEILNEYHASKQVQKLIICLLELDSIISSPVPLELLISAAPQGIQPEQSPAELTFSEAAQKRVCGVRSCKNANVCNGMFPQDKTAVCNCDGVRENIGLQPTILAAAVTDADKNSLSPPGAPSNPATGTATAPTTLEPAVLCDRGHTESTTLMPAATQAGALVPEPASLQPPDWAAERTLSLRVSRKVSGLQTRSAPRRKTLNSPMASA